MSFADKDLKIVNAISSIDDERGRRRAIEGTFRVLNYPPNVPSILPPGSVSALVAPQGSSVLDDISDAVLHGDFELAEELLNGLSAQLEDQDSVGIDEAVDIIRSEDIFIDIHYDKKVLASAIPTIRGIDASLVVFPYSGGILDDERFFINQWVREGTAEEVTTLFIKRPPVLSELEEAAIRLIPQDQLRVNIGPASYAMAAATIAVAIALAAIAVTAKVADGGVLVPDIPDGIIDLDRPLLSVGEIMKIRRDYLGGGLGD